MEREKLSSRINHNLKLTKHHFMFLNLDKIEQNADGREHYNISKQRIILFIFANTPNAIEENSVADSPNTVNINDCENNITIYKYICHSFLAGLSN